MESRTRYIADFDIAGMRYWDGATVLSALKVGEGLSLVAESDNAADPDAVAIYRDGVKLGYVPRSENGLVAQLLHFGHRDVLECRILKVDPAADTWKQVRVGLYVTDKTAGK